ncbi:MAG TPA: DUF1570 domain-containing protein [Pirellulales bacterium]|nr:DUF1570 domain-containing protein [Pirellulales bacterium]
MAALACAGALAGCMSLAEKRDALPTRNAIVFDQLVVNSDFPLPKHDRMLADLRVLRGDVMERLNLEASNEPIHVYLFDNEDRFRSFLAQHHPEFPARRAFFVESDARLAVYAQWGDRVAEDLRHEVTHGYLHSVVHDIPLWIDEGIAEYFEVPRSDVGLNRPHISLLLTRLDRNEWKPNLARLEHLQDAGDMAQEDYAEAWAWTQWLLDTEPRRRELLQNYLQAVRKAGSAEPLSTTIEQIDPGAAQLLVAHLQSLRPALAAQR